MMNKQHQNTAASTSRLLATIMLSLGFLTACGGGGDTSGQAPVSRPAAPSLSLDYIQTKQFRFTWLDVVDETEYRLLENPDGASVFHR